MRNYFKHHVLFTIVFTVAGATSAEILPLQKEMSNVFLGSESLLYQIPEFQRQLGVRMFVDFGPQQKLLNEVARPAFFSTREQLRNILDQFCGPRDLQWRYWPEARAVWIEYKDEHRRSALQDLSKSLNYDAPTTTDPFSGKTTITSNQIECLIDADANAKATNIFTGITQYYENGPSPSEAITIKVENDNWPKDVLAFTKQFLLEGEGRAAFYDTDEQFPPRRNQLLRLVNYPKQKESVSAKLLIKRIIDLHNNRPNENSFLGSERICWREAYRRYQFESKEITDALIECDMINVIDNVQIFGLDGWDAKSRFSLMTEIFYRCDRGTKLKMLKSYDLIPEPENYGPEYIQFWKNLAASKDNELSSVGREILKAYDNEVLKRGGSWSKLNR